ncbi:MAG: DMT family transporter [Alphaproteobacteria bacterium]
MTVRKDRLGTSAIVLLLAVSLAIGGQQTAVKFVAEGAPPVLMAALRAGAAALCLALWAWARGIALFRRDGTLKYGLAIGITGAAQFSLLFVGLEFTTAARATVFLYAAPFIIAAAAHVLVPGERMRRIQFAGMAVAFLGVVAAFSGRVFGRAEAEGLIGDALAFAAAFAWAGTILIVRAGPLIRGSAVRTLFYQMVFSLPCLLLVSLALGERWSVVPRAHALLGFAYLVLVVVCFGFVTWVTLLSRYPAAQIAAYSFLTPVFGVAAGALVLGETLSLDLLAGLALVSVGIYCVSAPSRHKSRPRTPY